MRSCAGPDIDLNYFCCYFIFLQVIHGQFVAGFYFTMLSNWLALETRTLSAIRITPNRGQ